MDGILLRTSDGRSMPSIQGLPGDAPALLAKGRIVGYMGSIVPTQGWRVYECDAMICCPGCGSLAGLQESGYRSREGRER